VRTKFAEAYNAINLARNGGLDFYNASMPPFWELEGAPFGTGSDNLCTVVTGDTPDSEQGAARYFKLRLAAPGPVALVQEVARRFVQPAFTSEFGLRHTQMKDVPGFKPVPNDWHLDNARAPAGYEYLLEAQLISDCEISLCFSVRVVTGKAKISARFKMSATQTEEVVVYPALESGAWVRPVVIRDLSAKTLQSFAIIAEKLSSVGLAEVHVGCVMLINGAYAVVPYTGDPMADAIPPGTMVFAVGDSCPLGFEKVVLTNMPERSRAYLKNAASTDLVVEGDGKHSHSDALVKMEPEVNWVHQLTNLGRGAQGESTLFYPADDGGPPHTHPLSEAESTPPTRDIIMCRRIG
jgi:hypothetical protein